MTRKLVLRCGLALGDIVMLTAAVRDLHRCYPGRFMTDVRTSCHELWENNPFISSLAEDDPEVEIIECSYPLIDHANERPYHCLHGFIEFLNSRLNLAIKPTEFRGDIHLSPQEKAWYSQVREVTTKDIPFWIINAGGKYDITIKWWETKRYQQVVDHFRGKIQFVQIGDFGHHHPKLDGVIDLRGKTNLRELVRLVHHAQGVLCSVTGLMHLASAVETKPGYPRNRPCVVIAGGREPAHWEAYPDHQFIHTNGALACCNNGGCWKDRVGRLRDGDKRDQKENLCVDVVGNLPRCMNLITSAEVIRRMDLYFQHGVYKFLSRAERLSAEKGIQATKTNSYEDQALNEHSASLACERFVKELPAKPTSYHGRGIVICGGGAKYFTNAWICINMLRHLGCNLPIQLWHLGGKEIGERMKQLMDPLGVECIDAVKVRKRFPLRELHGWVLKPFSILLSPFREVLFLDADNIPVVNPEYLFETTQFKAEGAVFWPDYPYENRVKARPAWRSCGLRQPAEPEFESGQMVLDKEKCWKALRLALWFNENWDFYYHHVHGDKETFHLAFRKLKLRYALIPRPIHSLRGTMCQHDFDGRRVFQHRNLLKWTLRGPNPNVNGFWFEKECRRFVKQLACVWSGAVE